VTRLISLVNPPGAAVERPCIGLGIIKSILSQAGHSVEVHYENLRYAEFIGVDLYRALLTVDPKIGLLDWLFAEAAFPDFTPALQPYVSRVFALDATIRELLDPEDLLELRQRSRVYIQEAVTRTVGNDTKLIGCSSSFCQHVASLALLRGVRVVAPTVTTMIGGANCEAIMGHTTHELFSWVDFVISGDAEELILPLADNIVSQGRNYIGSCGVQGVFSPADRAEQYANTARTSRTSRAVVRNMGLVPRPTYDDYFCQLDNLDFGPRVKPGLLLEASRGCWWGERSHCSFCGLNGGAMNYSSKDPADVLHDMAALTQEHKIDRVAFVDNILDHRYLHTLVSTLAARQDGYKIFVEIKANLKLEQVQLLAQAGIRWIQPGIESLDSRILKLMKKGSSAWQNILLLKWSSQFGIRLFWNIIFGTPGEQETWYGEQAKLIPLISHFQPALPVQLQYCRFSPYCENPAKYGVKLEATVAYKSIYPVSTEKLDDLVYFFDAISDKSGHGEVNREDPQKASPELLAFWKALALWRDEWRKGRPAKCQRVLLGEFVCVTDTRSCATETISVLNDCKSSVLDECEEGPPKLHLMRKMTTEREFRQEDVDRALSWLESRGFVLSIDERLISLVLPEAIPPLPEEEMFPGGYVIEELDRFSKRRLGIQPNDGVGH
jgi:ribosomal peptide maturation radical SAM protein 1